MALLRGITAAATTAAPLRKRTPRSVHMFIRSRDVQTVFTTHICAASSVSSMEASTAYQETIDTDTFHPRDGAADRAQEAQPGQARCWPTPLMHRRYPVPASAHAPCAISARAAHPARQLLGQLMCAAARACPCAGAAAAGAWRSTRCPWWRLPIGPGAGTCADGPPRAAGHRGRWLGQQDCKLGSADPEGAGGEEEQG